MRMKADRGQVIAEAPIAIVAIVCIILIMLQPAVVLYDRSVLNNAAAEMARIGVTDADFGTSGGHAGHIQAFLDRRVEAIPDSPYFRNGQAEYEIKRGADLVTVRLRLRVKPLPVFGAAASWLGPRSDSGEILVESRASVPTAWNSGDGIKGADPSSWKSW